MDFRARLENMSKASAMYAATREGFLMQVFVLLEVLGIEHQRSSPILYRIGVGKDVPSNVVREEHLRESIAVPDDPWAKEVIAAAIAMMPEGSGRFVLVPEP